MVEQMRIEVPYVNTVDNEADFFTKPLCSKTFHALRDVIMNVPESQREGKALKAFLAHRLAPLRRADPTSGEDPSRFWERMFSELGGAGETAAARVPEGTVQRVYWVDGTTVERISRDGEWDYSLLDSESLGPGSVHGGGVEFRGSSAPPGLVYL